MKQETLEQEIKELIISSLDLEDITVADIDSKAPLFTEGLGLDSIDALELGMALKKKYGVNFTSDKEENKVYFKSVENLAKYIAESKNITLE
ncbi:MAG: acyl carrier protein [Alphaproteobacteria bacterium]|nr:acyl carrier protein [Alphaproteobacteria bacterium]MBR0212158.1 acyl carrier protein [Alphaproteobacteria bacterium]